MPQEIEAGHTAAKAQGLDRIKFGSSRMVLSRYVEMLQARWSRAQATAVHIDAIRAGYVTIEHPAAPPQSRATH